MKKILVALTAAIAMILAVVPGAGAQNVGDEVWNDGTIYIGNGQCQGPKGNVFPCPFGGNADGSADGSATGAGTTDANATDAGATDGGSTDGYVPGDDGGADGTPAANCGPGPNGYMWYQNPCPPEYSNNNTGPNCGPGPNGYMWYQDPCPLEYSGGSNQPAAATDGGSEGQANVKVQVVDEKGDVLATANGDEAVITVAPAGTDRQLSLVNVETGEVVATSAVAAGGTVAAAKAPAAAAASALPNTGANSMNMAQLALILVAAGGVLVLFGRRSQTTTA